MWCLISQPNSVVVEVRLESKSKGQQVLEKACQVLGIKAEADYFGLRYTGVKGHDYWLNLRNPVERQMHAAPPFRFALRVKFWAPPHIVLQDSTRHQMYMQVRLDVLGGRLRPESIEARTKLASLMMQADHGDVGDTEDYSRWGEILGCHDVQDIVILHAQIQGMKTSTAEYWVLNEVSSLPNFGEESFIFKEVNLGIGPHGVSVYLPHPQTQIAYSVIRSASSLRRLFQLWYLNADGAETLLEIKCDSCVAASGLYRALTERHAFYSCDTVRGAVTAQYIRDLKGTIVSIFNEASPLGKKYVFDIRRTCREVHDSARRALYEREGTATATATGVSGCSDAAATKRDQQQHPAEVLSRLYDTLTCRICMDAEIDTVMFPCKHMVCCIACANRCSTCPLCRSEIESATKVYHPSVEMTRLRAH